MPTYTWSTTDKNSDVTLSGGNLIATHAGVTSQDEVVRAATSGSVNSYIEFVFGTLTLGSNNSGVGLANASASLSSYLGSDSTNAIGWFADGYVQGPGVAGHVAPTFIVGDVLGIGLLSSSIRLYKNGALAFTFPTLPAGALFPAASLYRQNDSVTANFGATSLAYLPSGFSSWDGTQHLSPILLAGSGTFALTGRAAGMQTSLGDFSPTDFSSDFLIGSAPSAGGVYSLAGRAAGLSIKLPVGSGSYGVAGRAAAMAMGEPLGQGTFALAGNSAALTSAGKRMAAGGGAFSLTGRVASFQGGIPVGTGAYTLSGGAAALTNIRPYGVYALTGRAASLNIGESSSRGIYTLTGNAARLDRGKGMLLGAGVYGLVGNQVASPLEGDTSSDFVKRLKSLIPRGWVLRTAPIFDAVLGGLADSLANFHHLLNVVRRQTRIATAAGWFLDLVGWDFLGANYLRKNKETDDHWRARIIREVLRPRATRLGIETALEDLTGRTPKIYEPWNATDDGGGYGAVGGRIAYGQSGYYGSVVLPAQVFVTAYKSGFSGIPNITGYGYGNGGYGAGTIAYASLTQVEGEISDAEIFDCVHQNIAAGAKAWVAIAA